MKRPLATRIIGLTVMYCVVFAILVILQFSNQGSFSLPVGGMTIRGRLAETEAVEVADEDEETKPITGGVRIYYGGLEFNLKEERGKGLTLTDSSGNVAVVNPQYMVHADNIVRFFLPGGAILTFNSLDSVRGTELQISAEFAGSISEIIIPIIPRRASLIQDAGQLGIMYSGSRYVFSSLGQELERGNIIFTRDNSFISYRSRGRQRAFDPADYVVAQESNYTNFLRSWQDSSFASWTQNTQSMQSEDDVIAYLSQAVQRGNFTTALGNIPSGFATSQRHSHRSSVYVGNMANAYSTFISYENEKMNLVTRLVRARSLDVFKEEHVLDFLLTRSNLVLANELIELVNNAQPEMLQPDHCAGLLEFFFDVRRWRPALNNPIEHLTEQMLVLIPEVLNRDTENDAVYASNSEGNISEFSVRLGKAIIFWAEAVQNTEWRAIGRSLVLSAISTGSAGRLHNILKPVDYTPRAAWLTDAGHWAWTSSPNIRATTINTNLNLAFSYPVNSTHHVIIRGVRPFLSIVIHGMVWRSDPQFERYESSGWVYYPDEQVLILKLRHRSSVENVRIIYRLETPAPAPVTPPPTPEYIVE